MGTRSFSGHDGFPGRASLLKFALLLALVPPLSAKYYVAERFDVQVRVLPDASVSITETVRFRFEGGQFSYVSRQVPGREVDRITGVLTEMDGLPAQADIRSFDGLSVTWHFRAEAGSTHEFKLSYLVKGVIRQGRAAAMLEWRALPDQRTYEIEDGSIEFECPPGTLEGAPEVAQAIRAEGSGNHLLFTLPALAANRSALLRAEFSPGFLPAPPDWQARQTERTERIVKLWLVGGIAALLAIVAGIAMLKRLRSSLRSPFDLPEDLPEVRTPPASLPPAVAACLVDGGTCRFPLAAMATLFDLAGRGVVAIRQLGKKAFTGARFVVERRARDAWLLPFESALLKIVFEERGKQTDACEFAKIGIKIQASWSTFKELLDQHLVSLGLIDGGRTRRKQRAVIVGLCCLLPALAIAGGGWIWSLDAIESGTPAAVFAAGSLAGVGTGALLVSVAGLIVLGAISTLSPQGLLAGVSWKAFRQSMREIAKGKAPADPGRFADYLPFAAAFGLGTQWVRRFRKEKSMPLPEWLEVTDGGADAMFLFLQSTAMNASSFDGGSSSSGGGGGAGGGSSSAG